MLTQMHEMLSHSIMSTTFSSDEPKAQVSFADLTGHNYYDTLLVTWFLYSEFSVTKTTIQKLGNCEPFARLTSNTLWFRSVIKDLQIVVQIFIEGVLTSYFRLFESPK